MPPVDTGPDVSNLMCRSSGGFTNSIFASNVSNGSEIAQLRNSHAH